jgi:glycosyltransferase involved in cell wall biosynthesis
VSVLIPSFNSGRYLGRAVASVLACEGLTLEVLVQDGGSTDATRHVLAGIVDPRVSCVVAPDAGQSDALNRALARASGDWVLWLNADDEVVPEALSRLARRATDDCDVVAGGFQTIGDDGRVLKTYRPGALTRENLVRHGCVIFSGAMLMRTSVLRELGGFDTSLDYCMDYDLLFRLQRRTAALVDDAPVARFRLQAESKSSNRAWSFLREHVRVAIRHGALERGLRARFATSVLEGVAYRLTLPLWQSATWRRLRPRKALAAS